MASRLADRNVLVTGGASGIGRQMVLRMARHGAVPIVWDINPDNLARVLDELRTITGRPAHGYLCDVTDRRAVHATASRVKQEVGPIHILVNNAGVVTGRPLLEATDDQIERTMAVNTMALFWTTRAFLPDMIAANSGHVVTIASAAGIVGVAGLVDYCASKWAAVGFDESLRMELRRAAPGVKTTVVCPYFIDTGMFHGVRSRFPWLLPILKEDVVAQRIVRAIASGRARLILPSLPRLVPLLRVLPVRWFDAITDFLGINRAMDAFVGRGEEK